MRLMQIIKDQTMSPDSEEEGSGKAKKRLRIEQVSFGSGQGPNLVEESMAILNESRKVINRDLPLDDKKPPPLII